MNIRIVKRLVLLALASVYFMTLSACSNLLQELGRVSMRHGDVVYLQNVDGTDIQARAIDSNGDGRPDGLDLDGDGVIDLTFDTGNSSHNPAAGVYALVPAGSPGQTVFLALTGGEKEGRLGSDAAGTGPSLGVSPAPGAPAIGLILDSSTDATMVKDDAAALTTAAITFGSGDLAETVRLGFTVPVTGVNGSTISWSASPAGIVGFTGGTASLAPGTEDTTVTLVARITEGDFVVTKTFTITVKGVPELAFPKTGGSAGETVPGSFTGTGFDFDGDGQDDLAVLTASTGGVYPVDANGDGTADFYVILTGETPVFSSTADGTVSDVTITVQADGFVSGVVVAGTPVVAGLPEGRLLDFPQVGEETVSGSFTGTGFDFDGDGADDITVLNPEDASDGVYEVDVDGDGTVDFHVILTPGNPPVFSSTDDGTGSDVTITVQADGFVSGAVVDGTPVVAGLQEGRSVTFPQSGGGTVTGIFVDTGTDTGFDFDGDGEIDFIVLNPEATDGIYEVDVDGDGTVDFYIILTPEDPPVFCSTDDGTENDVAITIQGGTVRGADVDGTPVATTGIFTVTFNSNGGSAVAYQLVASGGLATAPAAPTRAGYTFAGWYGEAALTTAWNFGTGTISADQTLWARWTAISYSITYQLDGGTNNGSNPASYTVETPTITLLGGTKPELNFAGWYDNAGLTGSAVTSIPVGTSGNKEFWAKWVTVATPAAPMVAAGNGQLSLTWTAAAGASAYEVWYSTANDSSDASQMAGDPITTTSATLTGLTNGTVYYVWLKAKNAGGSTTGFSPVSSGVPLGIPGAATPTAGNTQLSLSWTAVAGATAYEVWYGTSSNSAAAGKLVNNPSTTSATLTGLTNGTVYYVWLKARNFSGTSAFGPIASGTPVAPPLWTDIAVSADGTRIAATAYGGSIWTSTDSGETWTERVAGGAPKNWKSIASSSDGIKLTAAAEYGSMWTSSDSGATWTANTIEAQNWNGLASSSDGTKLVACAFNDYVWTSEDSGSTWVKRTGLNERVWRGVASSGSGTMRAVVSDGYGINISVDSGATWTMWDAPFRTGYPYRWSGIAISADGTKLAAAAYSAAPAGADKIWTSSDSGSTWIERTGAGTGTQAWLGIAGSSDGSKLAAVASDKKIWISADFGATWTPRTVDIGTREWTGIKGNSDGTVLVARTGDQYTNDGSNSIWVSTDSGITWSRKR